MADPRRRTSHVLEYLQKRAEDAKAEAEAEAGGDQPFLDFASQLGLDKPSSGGDK